MRRWPLPPFRYMAWAKDQGLAGVRFHLGLSGLPPPSPQLLPLDGVDRDLEQRGHDMPPRARSAVAARFSIEERQLMLTLGTSHAMHLVCAATLQPGDLCLVERPTYELLANLPGLFGARVERFDRSVDDGWRLDAGLPDRILARKPAMVLLTNPHNPTGTWLSREALAPVVDAAGQVGATVLVDEVYVEFFPDPMAHSAFGLAPHVATASSFTKALGLGTVRFGWLLAEPSLIAACITYNDYISVLYPNPSAAVGLAALEHIGPLKARAQRIANDGLAIARAWIDGRDDVSWQEPGIGIVGLLQLHRVSDTRAFCARLLRERETLVVPGEFFESPGFVRLGFGCDAATLEAGLVRIGEAL